MLSEDIENCDPNNVGAPKLFRSSSSLNQKSFQTSMTSTTSNDQNFSDNYSKVSKSSSNSPFKRNKELSFQMTIPKYFGDIKNGVAEVQIVDKNKQVLISLQRNKSQKDVWCTHKSYRIKEANLKRVKNQQLFLYSYALIFDLVDEEGHKSRETYYEPGPLRALDGEVSQIRDVFSEYILKFNIKSDLAASDSQKLMLLYEKTTNTSATGLQTVEMRQIEES